MDTLRSIAKYIFTNDPKAAMLPWKETNQTTIAAIPNIKLLPKKLSELRPYLDRCRPKTGSKNWTKLHFCLNVDPVHLTSPDGSDISDGFDDNAGACYPCTVQGSDDTLVLCDLAYTGPFTDVVQLKKEIREIHVYTGQDLGPPPPKKGTQMSPWRCPIVINTSVCYLRL